MDIFSFPLGIDKFTDGADLYLLSHYHRDHMDGLDRGWKRGPLVCSPVTANLLAELDGVPRENLIAIEPRQSKDVQVAGKTLRITALDANHCPGAILFIFECDGRRIIYTGDFRLNDELRSHKALLAGADRLYVDSTYASPEYLFPTQEESVRLVLDAVRSNIDKEILLALYTIGKNKIVEALFEEFGRPVLVTKDKLKAYQAMGCGQHVTDKRHEAGFIGYSRDYFDRYFRWTRERNPSNALVIYPSGMCLDAQPREGFFYVPYSEHCDWPEFCEFVGMVGAREVVKT